MNDEYLNNIFKNMNAILKGKFNILISLMKIMKLLDIFKYIKNDLIGYSLNEPKNA